MIGKLSVAAVLLGIFLVTLLGFQSSAISEYGLSNTGALDEDTFNNLAAINNKTYEAEEIIRTSGGEEVSFGGDVLTSFISSGFTTIKVFIGDGGIISITQSLITNIADIFSVPSIIIYSLIGIINMIIIFVVASALIKWDMFGFRR